MPTIGEANFHLALLVGLSLIVILLTILAITALNILDRLKVIDRSQWRMLNRMLNRMK